MKTECLWQAVCQEAGSWPLCLQLWECCLDVCLGAPGAGGHREDSCRHDEGMGVSYDEATAQR